MSPLSDTRNNLWKNVQMWKFHNFNLPHKHMITIWIQVKCPLITLKIKPAAPVFGFDPQLLPTASVSPVSRCLRKAGVRTEMKTINETKSVVQTNCLKLKFIGGLRFTCTGCWMMTGGGRLRSLSSSSLSREFSATNTDSISLLFSSSSSFNTWDWQAWGFCPF